MHSKTECWPPLAASSVASPDICVGSTRKGVCSSPSLALPSWPISPKPHEYRSPDLATAKFWLLPLVTLRMRTSASPSTFCGLRCWSAPSPRPSWLLSPRPKAYTCPSSVSASEWCSPPESWTTPLPSSASISMGSRSPCALAGRSGTRRSGRSAHAAGRQPRHPAAPDGARGRPGMPPSGLLTRRPAAHRQRRRGTAPPRCAGRALLGALAAGRAPWASGAWGKARHERIGHTAAATAPCAALGAGATEALLRGA
eukprot:scaffold128378_cov63-Phaeocystis_antarctica.AAC.2